MRQNILISMLMLVMLLSIPVLVTARMVHDFDCANCHKPGAGLLSLSNVCVDCHNTGMVGATYPLRRGGNTNPIPDKTFAIGDASDALGSVTAAGEIAGDQTSHNWAAKDTNPAAGASSPSDQLFYGDDNYSKNNVTCGRCHDPHGFDTNPKLLKLGVGTEAAMCNDCHVSWASDTAVSEGGSPATNVHPMVANYATIAAAKTAQYNTVPTLNAAPGEVSLTASGGIDCLTCHGVHWADSDASTTDGYGQALNSGDGKILKGNGAAVDQANVAGVSLCQSCHKYQDHGTGRTNPIGCLVCHGAHVEDVGGLMNNYMLREDITTFLPKDNASGTVTGLKANLISTPDQKQRLWDYCFTCHDSAVAVAGHSVSWNCVDCHGHDNATGSWAAAGGCNTCHGYPPSENVVSDGAGGNAGYASGYDSSGHFKNELTTQHSIHAGGGSDYSFACATCHVNNNHMAGDYADVFLAPMNSLVDASGQLAATYAAASGTCSAVYCHSNGGPRGAVPTVNNPGVWEGGAAINTCDACHGNDATDMVTRSNSATHIAHLNKGYSCQVCHTDTADSATTLAAGAITGTHINGDADVAFNGSSIPLALGATSYGSNGTCSIYCHSNGSSNVSPDWDDNTSGACGTCHQYSAAGVATGSGSALDNAHTVHLFAANGPKIASCSTCHTNDGASGAANSDHVNGVKDLVAGACDACHGTDGISATGTDRVPIWSDATSVDCETCHNGSNIAIIGGNTAPAKTNFTSLGHGDTGLTAAPACADCHDAAAAGHFDGDQLDKRLKVDPEADGGAEDYAVSTSGWCQDCHGQSVHYDNTHSAIGTDASIDGDSCIICHEPHGDGMGTNSDAMVIVGENFTDRNDPTSYFNGSNTGVCQTCHDPNEVGHYNSAGNDGHNSTTACYSCHSHSSTPEAFQGGECFACHGDGTAEFWPQNVGNDRTDDAVSDFNDAGRHQKHMEVLAAELGYTLPGIDAQQKEMCAYCHDISDGDHAGLNSGFADVFASPAKRLWNASDDADAAYDNVADTCATTDCHNSKLTLDNSYGWYDAATSACLMCHLDVTDGSTPNSSGGTHVAHADAGTGLYGVTITCGNCHDDATVWNTTAPAADHINGTLNVDFSYDSNGCGTNVCHNNGTGVGAPMVNVYPWGTVQGSACGICHASTPSTQDHTVHLSGVYGPAIGTSCNSCHQANPNNTSMSAKATHLNGTVTFKNIATPASPYEVTSSQIGLVANDGIDSCNLCHGGNVAANIAKDYWTLASRVSCESCHGDYDLSVIGVKTAPSKIDYASLGHGKGGVAQTCSDCHDSVSAAHIDGTSGNTVRLRTDLGAIYNASNAKAYCSVCHDGGAGNEDNHYANTNSAVGTDASTDGDNCMICHDPHGQQDKNSNALDAMLRNQISGQDVVGFADKTVRTDYYTTAPVGEGVCQVCHDQNEVANFNRTTASAGHGGSGACNTCHAHTTTPAFKASCFGCHGDGSAKYWPQTAGTNDTTTDDVLTDFNDDGRHTKHMTILADKIYSEDLATLITPTGNGTADVKQRALCSYCHDIADVDHASNSNADVFRSNAKQYWQADENAAGTDTNAAYTDDVNGTCATTDCHNNKTTVAGTYGWYDNPANQSACIMCHDDVTGQDTHNVHLQAATATTYGITIGCSDCHYDATGPAAIVFGTTVTGKAPATGHWNGQWDTQVKVATVETDLYDGSWSPSTKGSCGTNDCHNDGTATPNAPVVPGYKWGTAEASACGICHAATPTSGSHNGHFSAVYGPLLNGGGKASCSACHDANANNTSMGGTTRHMNRKITFSDSVEIAAGDIDDGSNTISSCNTCHGGAADANAAKGYWYTATRVTCESCHVTAGTLSVIGNTAPAKDAFVAEGHGIVSLNTPADRTCQSCHDQNDAGHFDGDQLDLRLQGSPKGVSGANTFALDSTLWCQECHTSMNTHYHTSNTVSAGNESLSGDSCVICHDPHGEGMGTNSDAMLIVGASFTDRRAASSYFNGSNNGVCQTCHDSAEVLHYANDAASDGHNATTQCNSCHAHTTDPAFQGGECFDCHGDNSKEYWPQDKTVHNTNTASAQTDFNDDGRHSKHMELLASKVYSETLVQLITDTGTTSDTKQRTLCAYCHDIADSDHASTGGPADVFRSNGKQYWQADPTAAGSDTDAAYVGGSCNTVDCHNNQSTGTGTYGWYDDPDGTNTAKQSSCIMCHADVSATDTATGITHTKHTGAASSYGISINCASCHDDATVWGTTYGTGTVPATGHWNGQWNIDQNGGPLYSQTWASGAMGSCGTNNCHNDGTITPNAPVIAGYTWGAADANDCGMCHKTAMDSNAHDEHLTNSNFVAACTSCHTAATAATHIAGSVSFDTPISVYTTGDGTCTNSCHSVTVGRDWTSGAALVCNDCHGDAKSLGVAAGGGAFNGSDQPTTGRHAEHLASSYPDLVADGCSECHGHSGALGISGSSGHVDGSKTVDGTNLSAVSGTPVDDCTNRCHDVDLARGDWNDAAALACADCHADAPTNYIGPKEASGLHHPTNVTKHAEGSFNCTDCHNNAVSVTNKHIDGTTDNATAAVYAWGAWVTSYSRAADSCTASCHTDSGAWGRKWTNAVDAVPLTSDSTKAAVCKNCHGSFEQGWNSGISERHTLDVGVEDNHSDGGDNQCYLCHGWGHANYIATADVHNKTTLPGGIIHVNSAAQVGYVDNGDTVGCANCHASNDGLSDGGHEFQDTNKLDTGNDPNNGPDKWTRVEIAGPAGDCDSCHDSNIFAASGANAHAGSNEDQTVHNTHNESVYIDANGNFVDGTTSSYDNCNTCHGHNGSAGHNNGTVQFDGSNISATYNYATSSSFGGTCGATNGCHDSDPGDWTAGSLMCADCHDSSAGYFTLVSGYPPATGEHTPHIDNNALLPNNCYDCHKPGPTHKNKQIEVDNEITDGSQLSVDGTCTNTCHTVVDGRDWTSNSTLICNDCHGTAKSLGVAAGGGAFNGSDQPTTGRHAKHLASSLNILSSSCTDCHGHSGALGNYGTTGHADGAKSIDAVNLTAVALPDCTNSCHDVDPAGAGDWADSAGLDCENCHSGSYVGSVPTSGLHGTKAILLSHTTAGIFNCSDCHANPPTTGVSHMNNTLDAFGDAGVTFDFNAGNISYDANGCAATCHIEGNAWSRRWNGVVDVGAVDGLSPDSPVCGNCHGTFGTGWRTGVSGRHEADSGIEDNHRYNAGNGDNDCALCHGWGDPDYPPNTHRNSGSKVLHLNQNVGFEDNSAVDGLVGCASCHASSDGTANGQHSFVDTETDGTEGVERWTRGSVDGAVGSCYSCHQTNGATHGGSNESLALHNSHNASPYIDSDGNFVAGDGSTFNNCITCHGHNGTGGHVNGTVVFAGSVTAPASYTLAGDSYDGSCTTTCHTTEAGEWNTTTGLGAGATDACTSCHAFGSGIFVALSDYPPNTNVHTRHLNSSYAAACADCHPHSGDVSHANHVADDGIQVTGTEISVYATGTCTNSCHLVDASRNWTAGSSLACYDCHGASGKTYDRSWTGGSHSKHIDTAGLLSTSYGSMTNSSAGATYDFGCGECHPDNSIQHIDGGVDVNNGSNDASNIAYSTGSCSATYCHSYLDASAVRQYQTTPIWNGGSFTGDSCAACHGNSPVSGAHSVHKIGIHADDIDDGDGTTEGIYSGVSGNVASSATSPSAHGDGTTSTVLSCNTCHNNTVNIWYNALNSACSNCHTAAGSGSNRTMIVTDTSRHVDGTIDVIFQNISFKSKAQVRDDITGITELNSNWTRTNGYKTDNSYDLAKTNLNIGSFNSGDSTCSAVSCHNGFKATWETPTGDCGKCHTSLPQ